ncbi:Attractin-like protein 1 [Sarcoptes scabiei]|uniref:Attractin-like protein 1 n=1 Tax=Sarcoptes scabiei TaxID=52283 RepID=A0A132A1Z0_SARSC|nr:Attractin-like protein 1 [Sarcoptes scabiei]
MFDLESRFHSFLKQLFVELEQMASRPFAGVVVQMMSKNDSNNSTVSIDNQQPTNPSPIALEPLSNGKAAVLTMLIKLPTGTNPIPQPGQTGIALASSLVTLGNVTLEQNCLKKEKNARQKISTNQAKLDLNPSFSTGV